jgi:transposase
MMSRPPVFPAEQKMRIVLSILAGEITAADAARQFKVSEQSIGTWKRQFMEGGRAGLESKASGAPSREAELEAEVEELKAALGEATVELRVWKKSVERLAPSRTSR